MRYKMLKHKTRQIYYKHVHIKIDMFFPRYNNKSKENGNSSISMIEYSILFKILQSKNNKNMF